MYLTCRSDGLSSQQTRESKDLCISILDHALPNSQILFIGDFVRIVCDLTNKYFLLLSSTSGDQSLQNKCWNISEKETN